MEDLIGYIVTIIAFSLYNKIKEKAAQRAAGASPSTSATEQKDTPVPAEQLPPADTSLDEVSEATPPPVGDSPPPLGARPVHPMEDILAALGIELPAVVPVQEKIVAPSEESSAGDFASSVHSPAEHGDGFSSFEDAYFSPEGTLELKKDRKPTNAFAASNEVPNRARSAKNAEILRDAIVLQEFLSAGRCRRL